MDVSLLLSHCHIKGCREGLTNGVDGRQQQNANHLSLLQWPVVVSRMAQDVDESDEARHCCRRPRNDPADPMGTKWTTEQAALLHRSGVGGGASDHHDGECGGGGWSQRLTSEA